MGGGKSFVLADTIFLAIVVPLVNARIGDCVMYWSVSFFIAWQIWCGVYWGWNGRIKEI